MFTAPNPGPKTLDGTHTFVVGRKVAYIIDPGPESGSYQADLAEWLKNDGAVVRAVLLTHGHPDHAPGAVRLKGLLDVPILASTGMPEQEAEALGAQRELSDGQYLTTDGDRLGVLGAPGHTADHVVFWLEGARVLFAGDVILGQGTTLIAPPEGDMVAYLQTLEKLRRLDARVIAPGHGPLIDDPVKKIDEYVRHRKEREEQIVRALQSGPTTVEDLVRRVYVDVDPRLHGLAAGSVHAQLLKLCREGRAQEVDGVYRVEE